MAQSSSVRARANQALQRQLLSLTKLDNQFGDQFEEAVALLTCATFVLTTGLGKSGFIAKKMAASLTSVQCPSVYVHPVDALHGDSGLMKLATTVIAFSKSGETPEVLRFLESTLGCHVPIISICSRKTSSINTIATVPLIAEFEQELDDDNILPTASTTSSLVLADILTVIAAQERGAGILSLKETHPQGSIGSGLMRTVEECMHFGTSLPFVRLGTMVIDALVELSTKSLGVVCVMDAHDTLHGILTDGDVRRLAVRQTNFAETSIEDVMTSDPTTISAEQSLREALILMEQPQRQLSVLPVVQNGKCIGVLRLHDVVRMPNA